MAIAALAAGKTAITAGKKCSTAGWADSPGLKSPEPVGELGASAIEIRERGLLSLGRCLAVARYEVFRLGLVGGEQELSQLDVELGFEPVGARRPPG